MKNKNTNQKFKDYYKIFKEIKIYYKLQILQIIKNLLQITYITNFAIMVLKT